MRVQPPAAPARRPKAAPEPRTAVFSGFSHVFLLVWGAMVVFPLLWVVLSSFKDDAQILKEPLSLIPELVALGQLQPGVGRGPHRRVLPEHRDRRRHRCLPHHAARLDGRVRAGALRLPRQPG